MKFKIFKMLIMLGIMLAIPLVYMGRFEPMAFLDSGLSAGRSGFDELKGKAPKNLSNAITDEKVQVYKWRDKNGVMQFSNVPPADGGKAQRVTLDPNSNLMQAVKTPEKTAEPEQKVATKKSLNPYSVKGAKKVIDDAMAVEDMINQRHEQQQKMLNDI